MNKKLDKFLNIVVDWGPLVITWTFVFGIIVWGTQRDIYDVESVKAWRKANAETSQAYESKVKSSVTIFTDKFACTQWVPKTEECTQWTKIAN